MPEIIDWQQAAPCNAAVGKAAQALSEGRIVVFPTECAYVAAASPLFPDAVANLGTFSDENAAPGLCLALRDADEALAWVPEMSPVGRRLARRCWPGPIELVWGMEARNGLLARLAEPVRERLFGTGTLGFRAPAHPALQRTMLELPGPVALLELGHEQGDPTTAEQAARRFAHNDVLVLDDGPPRYERPATIVRLEGNAWHIVREGIVSREILARLTCCVVLFVCTGNTCRSPLAEGLCRKLLADRLACRPEELPEKGFIVQSAGLSAMMGGRAADEAVAVARQYGADLSSHVSQPLTAECLAHADFVLTMTRSHLLALQLQFPSLGPLPRLLAPDGYDIADPIGCSETVYLECAQQILGHLQPFLQELFVASQ